MTPYYEDDHVTLFCGDALEVLDDLAADSVGLVLSDPPYFRVKGDWWDRQWDTADGFIEWVGELSGRWRRVLVGNGSVYCFASPKMAARVEVAIGEQFNVLSAITWAKPDPFSVINQGASNAGRVCGAALRSYYPNTERVVFAEQFGQDTTARGAYTKAEADLRRSVFEPIQIWLASERDAAGWTNRQVDQLLGTAGMAGHYFSNSQWALPTADAYNAMREAFNDREYVYLRREYEDLRREYEDLRREYEDLRRPFNVTKEVPFTDVWTYGTVAHYVGKHPCEKPAPMLRDIINASHRPSMEPVLDCFAGSGSTLFAAKELGRNAIGIEIDERYCEIIANRLSQETLPLSA